MKYFILKFEKPEQLMHIYATACVNLMPLIFSIAGNFEQLSIDTFKLKWTLAYPAFKYPAA